MPSARMERKEKVWNRTHTSQLRLLPAQTRVGCGTDSYAPGLVLVRSRVLPTRREPDDLGAGYERSRVGGSIALKGSRHFQPEVTAFPKQGSVEEELKRSESPVQVELKLRRVQPPKCGCSETHWKYCSGK